MDTSRKAVGARIRALREELDLQQKEFARLIQVSNKTLSSYENGDSYPSFDALTRIVRHGNTDANWIIFGAGMPKVDRKKISEQEIRLLELFRIVSEKDRETILKVVEMAAEKKHGKTGSRQSNPKEGTP